MEPSIDFEHCINEPDGYTHGYYSNLSPKDRCIVYKCRGKESLTHSIGGDVKIYELPTATNFCDIWLRGIVNYH